MQTKNKLTSSIKNCLILTISVVFSLGCVKKDIEVSIITENSMGLISGNPVILKGVKVGQVREVDLFKGKVIVTCVLEKKHKIPLDTKMMVSNVDLFEKCLELFDDVPINGYWEDNDTLYYNLSYSTFDK